jgi:predicted component of type VI protein secretion system
MRAIAKMLQAGKDCCQHLELQEVLAHAQRLLNSRKGQAGSAPQYGISFGADTLRDVLEHLPQTEALIESTILATLTAHEPRLTAWRQRAPTVLGAHSLTLLLHATWTEQAHRPPVAIDVHVAPAGRVRVTSP